MRYYTPLRYPGGKSSLSQFMRQIFVDNNLLDGIYVEPYAGGAGVALELLMTDYVKQIWLNDLDPAIYSFWHAALYQTDELINLVHNAPLTIQEWHTQKEIYQSSNQADTLQLGFATFYLNRTNRSGILNGGVIGGIGQSGKYLIDARFNRENLAERIRLIGEYRNRIHLYNSDAHDFLSTIELPKKSLVYIDPPYFHKGQRLYRNHYNPKDHVEIADIIQTKLPYNWIVSYDDTPEISKLYPRYRKIHYSLQYSAHTKRKGGELMIFSKGLRIPRTENPSHFKIQ